MDAWVKNVKTPDIRRNALYIDFLPGTITYKMIIILARKGLFIVTNSRQLLILQAQNHNADYTAFYTNLSAKLCI